MTHFLGNDTGQIGFVVILLFFFYYFAVILLLGAEINVFFAEGIRATPDTLPAMVHQLTSHLPTSKKAIQEQLPHHIKIKSQKSFSRKVRQESWKIKHLRLNFHKKNNMLNLLHPITRSHTTPYSKGQTQVLFPRNFKCIHSCRGSSRYSSRICASVLQSQTKKVILTHKNQNQKQYSSH